MARKKRMPTKWHPAILNGLIPDAASGTLIVADALALMPTSVAQETESDILAGWCRGTFAVSREAIGDRESIAWAVVQQRLVFGSATPVQTFSPFDLDDLKSQDILGMGMVNVPPVVLIPSSDAASSDRGTQLFDINIRVGRKLNRNSNNLFLWVVSTDRIPPGVDNAFNITGCIRTLMKFP